ncbi:hypothetical protein HZH68_003603 [Vespula germanica]|uniref:Uncharacterized protein n=1 Tax=Vespula germanica TaxID=30212 RepID=A0A834NPF2_VESGE|nr:hypothetical protein HZH68_003603 [Vespula germanica]
MSTYLIFNQLRIIHPQFRPKSRSSVLEPSQNFLSNTTGRVSRCLKLKFSEKPETPEAERHLERECKVESPLARGSPNAATSKWWHLGRHDRSCLEISEADGVDSGAICKRGFTHLQFAEKPEAPEAERHLGSWILE